MSDLLQRLSRFRTAIRNGILFVLVIVLLRPFVEAMAIVDSSHSPTLLDGDRVLVNKVSAILHGPARHDLVIYRSPLQPEIQWLGRVIGLPREHIEVRNGALHVDGKEVAEPYLQEAMFFDYDFPTAEDEYFIVQDRRNACAASFWAGPVPGGMIVGRLDLLFWPPLRIGPVR